MIPHEGLRKPLHPGCLLRFLSSIRVQTVLPTSVLVSKSRDQRPILDLLRAISKTHRGTEKIKEGGHSWELELDLKTEQAFAGLCRICRCGMISQGSEALSVLARPRAAGDAYPFSARWMFI